MPFFQNPFDSSFTGSWLLGDREFTNFNLKGNVNRADATMAFVGGPYDLSTLDTLTIKHSFDMINYATLEINIAGATPSATQASEIVEKLNADSTFSGHLEARVGALGPQRDTKSTVVFRIKESNRANKIRFYIANTGAEQKLQFNKKAPIGELPTYFNRHAIGGGRNFPDSVNMLLLLDPNEPYDASLINATPGLDASDPREDYELLKGKNVSFMFKKLTYDGSSRLISSLEYQAGSQVGDLAVLIQYQYAGAATNPSVVTEIPHILESGDMVTPP